MKAKFKARVGEVVIEECVDLSTDSVDISDKYELEAFMDGQYELWLLRFGVDDGWVII